MYFALFYEVVPDYLDRRVAFRPEHLELARAAVARGELVLAGAFAEPADGALFIFRGDAPGAAEAFVAADPYVTNGLVTRWWVRPWTVVVGSAFSPPS